MMLNNALPGTVFLFYSLVYACFRFFIEFIRGDYERPLWLGASEAQWTSVIIVLILLFMGNLGWFPYYSWHTATAIFLILFLIVTIAFYNTSNRSKLMNHRHINEIASGISFLSCLPDNLEQTGRKEINLYKTSRGFNISKDSYGVNKCFYTISYKKELEKSTLNRIAKFLKIFNKAYTYFSIEKSGKSVYHFLFWNDENLVTQSNNNQ